jgi:predicted phosphodiesterase
LSKQKRQKKSSSQRILWLLSVIMVGSMVLSLVLVALPTRPAPAPTPFPTFSATTLPAFTPPPLPTEPPPTLAPVPSPTLEATAPIIGPELPTDAPAVSPTITATLPLTVTPTGAGTGFRFAACGDSRGNPDIYGQVLEAVMADGSEFLLHTGDLVNRGTESEWQEFQQTMAGFTLPFHPVPGNHDGLDGQLDGYLAYSGAPAAHYSFDQDPVHFTLVDSHNGGIGAGELAWLRDDLSATTQPIKMVFLHHPPFDPDGTDHIMAFGNEEFMALMAEQQVNHVFAGHIHAYAQAERDGVHYTITGGAGATLYREDHPQAYHHYLRVTVQGTEVSIEVVEV